MQLRCLRTPRPAPQHPQYPTPQSENQIANKEHADETDAPSAPTARKNIIMGGESAKKRESSPLERPINTERDYERTNNNILQKLQDSKKRNSASGKIIGKVSHRTPSNPKRSE
jgi:hypothetical protein